eukprot:EG_transcript_14456
MSAPPPGWLYFDILNFSGYFFPHGAPWNLQHAVRSAERLCDAAQASGFGLKVFIDAEVESDEAIARWRKRREDEVRKMKRDMPQGLLTLLGEVFAELGVEVHYSVERDLDDTLAFFAEADKAAVVSGDSDFFRYTDSTFLLYSAFSIVDGQLVLEAHPGRLKPGVQRRALGPKPATMDRHSILIGVLQRGQYVRGAPTPLVQLLGNPHVHARPLRQALYAQLGVVGPVWEEFPVWDGTAPAWDAREVMPDGGHRPLLQDPIRAVHRFFPELASGPPPSVRPKDWQKHVFAVHAVVQELCAIAAGTSMLRGLMRSLAIHRRPQNGGRGGGRAAGGKGAAVPSGKGHRNGTSACFARQPHPPVPPPPFPPLGIEARQSPPPPTWMGQP